MKKCTIENLTILALALIAFYLILGVVCCGCAGPTPSQRILIDSLIDNAQTLDAEVTPELDANDPDDAILIEFLHSNKRTADELERQLRGDE